MMHLGSLAEFAAGLQEFDAIPERVGDVQTLEALEWLSSSWSWLSLEQQCGSLAARGMAYLRHVSSRLDASWVVVASPSTPSVDRCVDIFSRPDGTFGFEEFRRDPEDLGAWTPVAYYSEREYATAEEAMLAARESVRWLGDALDASR
jgi:hypothetical protein